MERAIGFLPGGGRFSILKNSIMTFFQKGQLKNYFNNIENFKWKYTIDRKLNVS